MNNDQSIVETEGYEMSLEVYLEYEWYAAQLELTVDYFLDEFFIDDTLIIPPGLVPYEQQCDS